jgi:hypothetical protein
MTDLVLMLGDLKLVVPVSELKKMMEQQKAKPVVVAKATAPTKASSPAQADLPLDNVSLVRFRKNSEQDRYGIVIQQTRPGMTTFVPYEGNDPVFGRHPDKNRKVILNAASRLRKQGYFNKVDVFVGTRGKTPGYFIRRIS